MGLKLLNSALARTDTNASEPDATAPEGNEVLEGQVHESVQVLVEAPSANDSTVTSTEIDRHAEPVTSTPRWFVHEAGTTFGPFDPVQMAFLEREGRLFSDSLVAPVGATDWLQWIDARNGVPPIAPAAPQPDSTQHELTHQGYSPVAVGGSHGFGVTQDDNSRPWEALPGAWTAPAPESSSDDTPSKRSFLRRKK